MLSQPSGKARGQSALVPLLGAKSLGPFACTRFIDVTEESKAGRQKRMKTRIWRVYPERGPRTVLGHVRWYVRWRRYVFVPEPNTGLDATNMHDIATFMKSEQRTYWDTRRGVVE